MGYVTKNNARVIFHEMLDVGRFSTLFQNSNNNNNNNNNNSNGFAPSVATFLQKAESNQSDLFSKQSEIDDNGSSNEQTNASIPLKVFPNSQQTKPYVKDQSCWYRLMSVVLHYGSHDSGHFVTYRRIPSPSSRESLSSFMLTPREGLLGVNADKATLEEKVVLGIDTVNGKRIFSQGKGEHSKKKGNKRKSGSQESEMVESPPRWFRISDDKVDLVHDVEGELFIHGSAYIYMLFYEKV
jgi:hypothetical protein